MKIGLLAYSTNTGLGYQTLDFAKHIECEKILIADLGNLNHMTVHHERYTNLAKEVSIANGIPSDDDMEWLTNDVDLIFVCETPLNWNLFKIADQKDVVSVLQFNYEFLEYFRHPNYPAPTVLASPSFWNIEAVQNLKIAPVEYLPVPIDTKKIPFREITEIKTLLHIMGRPAVHDRNGTLDFLRLALALGKEYRYKIYGQKPQEMSTEQTFYPIKVAIEEAKNVLGDNLEVYFDTEDNRSMYEEGDLFVLPRKYGGLCLPLWEAMSAGIPALMTQIDPNDKVLELNWLAKSEPFGTIRTHSDIPMYKPTLESMLEAFQNHKNNIMLYNQIARVKAEEMSWGVMKRKYLNLFKKYANDSLIYKSDKTSLRYSNV